MERTDQRQRSASSLDDNHQSDGVDELESQYQTEKLLSEGTWAQAEIVEAMWTESTSERLQKRDTLHDSSIHFYIVLDVHGGERYSVQIPDLYDHDERRGLVALYEGLNVEPTANPQVLAGHTVEVRTTDDLLNKDILISAGHRTVAARRVDEIPSHRDYDGPLKRPLPEQFVSSLKRTWKYALDGDTSVGVQVRDLSKDGDDLVLHLEDGWGDVRFETTSQNEDSAYTRLVEQVGQGSVREIKGSKLYFGHLDDLGYEGESTIVWKPDILTDVNPHYVTLKRNRFGDWLVFSGQESPYFISDFPNGIAGYICLFFVFGAAVTVSEGSIAEAFYSVGMATACFMWDICNPKRVLTTPKKH